MSKAVVSFLAGSNMVICMVAVCRVSKNGKLLEIREASDKYRDIPYDWDED